MAEEFQVATRHGLTRALGAPPGGSGRVGAVVLLHEYWGLNAHIASLVDRFAQAGFIAVAPDLFNGQTATTPEQGSALAKALSWDDALEVIDGAVAQAKADPRSNGRVAVLGFCLGGAGAFVCAARLAGLSAAVVFYGVPPATAVDWSTADPPPIQAHFASRDQWATADKARDVLQTLALRGRPMELHVYDAGHAFMNDTRPEAYDQESAVLAWQRATEFLHQHLDG